MSEAYELLSAETAAGYIDARPGLAARVDTSTLDVREIGDGNLNLVFVCQDAAGRGLVLKQALPYVRMAGPSWPFTPRRAVAEARSYRVHGELSAEHLPELYAFDPERYVLAVEDLSDHRVWRVALGDGERHDQAADAMGRYVARVAFGTSALGVDAAALKGRVAEAVSPELCGITEALVLTEPFSGAERNWFAAGLGPDAVRLQAPEVRAAAAGLKWRFMTAAEALVHGDLHTGSVMVREDGSTRAFDGEFCFYGPVGFDLGLLWANQLIALARSRVLGRADHAAWLATLPAQTWSAFAGELSALWPGRVDPEGFPDGHLERWLGQVARDAAGFAACEAARRVVGYAHVTDLETLEEQARVSAGRGVLRAVEGVLRAPGTLLEDPAATIALARQAIEQEV